MKNALLIILPVIGLFLVSMTASWAMTDPDILQRVDAVERSPSDTDVQLRMVLMDEGGSERVREARVKQKGSKRLFKFQSPADVKGVGVLVLEDDVMYLYMPAFGKVRRIGSSAKNDTFMGTDFSFDDMGTLSYADNYDVSELAQEGESYVLTLTPKASGSDYHHLKMWVQSGNSVYTKIEYYGRDEALTKVLTRSDIRQIGDYWFAFDMVMETIRTKHRTRMEIVGVECDNSFTDSQFSERYLKRD